MNFIAHIFLSCQNEDILIGNFIADSIRHKELSTYSTKVQRGILLHRHIDSYTDQHPLVKAGTHRLHSKQGKYALVVIDIFYDYILSHNWELYSNQPLSLFSKNVYAILTKRLEELPPLLQQKVPIMIEQDWLMKYGTEDGLRYVFERLEKRAKFPNNFDKAVDQLFEEYQLFETEFNAFFPQVIEEVSAFCTCMK